MPKAGVVVDDWKLPVFRKRLEAAGFTYTDAGPATGTTTMLHVQLDDLEGHKNALQRVLEQCQLECRKARR